MFHELTKAEKRALRAAADLAYDRDRVMPREDRDVYYLQARNSDLPIVVAGAVMHAIITIDDVDIVARGMIEALSKSLEEMAAELSRRESVQVEEADPHDPNAVVSVAAIVDSIDMLSGIEDGALYVNSRSGEVRVSFGDNDDEDDIDYENDEEWVYLFSRHSLDEITTMRKFARNARPAASQELLDALSGRGAYRHFREVIRRRGLQSEWDAYRDAKRADLVRFELQERKIAFRR